MPLRAANPGAGRVLQFTINYKPLCGCATVFWDKLALATMQGDSPLEDQCLSVLWGVSEVWGFETQLSLR